MYATSEPTPALPGLLLPTDQEFADFRRLAESELGLQLGSLKKALLANRLGRRVHHRGLASFGAYYRLLTRPEEEDERRLAIELLTTNETYFFREPAHFDFLRLWLETRPPGPKPVRIWCAACASGEEAYSIAMLLFDQLGPYGWELLASDVNTDMLRRAERAVYPVERTSQIPEDYRRRFCLKGVGEREGQLRIEPGLRRRVHFEALNLHHALPDRGLFDLVFLRNVLIYFGAEARLATLHRVIATLRPGAYLLVGHAESLSGLDLPLSAVRAAVYRKHAGEA